MEKIRIPLIYTLLRENKQAPPDLLWQLGAEISHNGPDCVLSLLLCLILLLLLGHLPVRPHVSLQIPALGEGLRTD
jgi:hypothetical protein